MLARKNIPLLIGFLLPVLLVIFIALSVYIPRFLVHPQYNFLYSISSDYYYSSSFTIVNKQLIKVPPTNPPVKDYATGEVRQVPDAILYIHDVVKNSSTEISFEEAQKLDLIPGGISPDGLVVGTGVASGGYFPMFWYRAADYNSQYLQGKGYSMKMNIQKGSAYVYNAFRHIAWIKRK